MTDMAARYEHEGVRPIVFIPAATCAEDAVLPLLVWQRACLPGHELEHQSQSAPTAPASNSARGGCSFICTR